VVEPVPELGRVGDVVEVNPDLVRALWDGGFVPVIAPLGSGPEGAYNVNADSAAAALAVGLGAAYLFLLTDVDGLQAVGDPVDFLAPDECEGYVESGQAAGGMVPKLRAASMAAHGGAEARIVNGNKAGVLAAAIAGAKVGTLISGRVATSCKQ
jgi:acetylglutamate kinase